MPKATLSKRKTMPAKPPIKRANTTRSSSTKKLTPSSTSFAFFRRLNKLPLILFVLAFAGIGSYMLFISHAATMPILTTEAEAMTLPAGTTIIADTTASNSQAIQLTSNGTTTTTINLPSTATGFTITAKGTQCKGSPTMVTKVDGVQVGSNISISATGWTSYPYTKALTAGSHSFSIAFTNYSTFKNCAKRLFVDKVVWSGEETVTPVPPVVSTNPLSWKPPTLTSPTTIDVNDSTARVLYLDNAKDYIIKLGTITQPNGLIISGGRNIVMVGGHIYIPSAGTNPSIESRRGLYLERNVGTVHIEGLLIDGPDLSEGIQIAAPNAIVQIQNVRMVNVHARDQVNFSDNHPDCIQPWGGVLAIRIDRLTCSTDTHALYWDSHDSRNRYGAGIGSADVRRYNVKRTLKSDKWAFQRVTVDFEWPMTLTEVYIEPEATTSLYNSIGDEMWSNGGTQYNFLPATISSDGLTASWPQDKNLTGVIKKGPPPAGDFVPDGIVGANYVSPGYQ